MVFSSVLFLFYFLPLVLIGHQLLPERARNGWLLAMSLVFYAWGVGGFVFVMLASAMANWRFGLGAEAARAAGNTQALRGWVIASAAVNVGLLAVFKYAGFAFDQINALSGFLGAAPLPAPEIVLPIGISFFTFQSMSYVFDAARGAAPAQKSLLRFALYVALFPQLVAGPIVRYAPVAAALERRRLTRDGFTEGAERFAWGLIKKVVIADALAPVADAAFAAEPGSMGAAAAWIGLVAYTLQIYFDFSGYSDMAIGLGRMLGFRFPENFARPYSAVSVTDFWRRWHMSLSSWFRDYVYIPLGGSRGAPGRVYANLWIVFLLTGLWHGAAWTFVLWGAWHGLLLTVERATGYRDASRLPAGLRSAVALLLVMLGWVLFRADSTPHAMAYYASLFGAGGGMPDALVAAIDNRALVTLVLASAVFFLPPAYSGWAFWRREGRLGRSLRLVGLAGGFAYALVLSVAGGYTAFLYFQF